MGLTWLFWYCLRRVLFYDCLWGLSWVVVLLTWADCYVDLVGLCGRLVLLVCGCIWLGWYLAGLVLWWWVFIGGLV